MDAMKYHDLRDFLTLLEHRGTKKRITLPVILIWKSRKSLTARCGAGDRRCCLKILALRHAGAV